MTPPRPPSPKEVESTRVGDASRQTERTRPSFLRDDVDPATIDAIEYLKVMERLACCDAKLIETLGKSP